MASWQNVQIAIATCENVDHEANHTLIVQNPGELNIFAVGIMFQGTDERPTCRYEVAFSVLRYLLAQFAN